MFVPFFFLNKTTHFPLLVLKLESILLLDIYLFFFPEGLKQNGGWSGHVFDGVDLSRSPSSSANFYTFLVGRVAPHNSPTLIQHRFSSHQVTWNLGPFEQGRLLGPPAIGALSHRSFFCWEDPPLLKQTTEKRNGTLILTSPLEDLAFNPVIHEPPKGEPGLSPSWSLESKLG